MKPRLCLYPQVRLFVCLIVLSRLSPAQGPAVPSNFKDLFNLLSAQLLAFNNQLDAVHGAGSNTPAYAALLSNADANIGPQMLLHNHYAEELKAMRALGTTAVMIQMGFPMLYRPFFTSQKEYDRAVTYYQHVAQNVRSYGMKLIVENNTLPSEGSRDHWNTGKFYKTLDWAQYQTARAEAAVEIAKAMHPDYLVVMEEPDSEAAHTGQSNVNTPDGATALTSGILQALHAAGVTGVKYSGGVGTWLSNYKEFIHKFVALPLDAIDIHIYPINYDNLPRALEIAKIAASAGKPVSMSECWMNKIRNNELGVLTTLEIEARDPFGFWAPLDSYFVNTIAKFAAGTNMAFVSFFESHELWIYLSYSAVKQSNPTKILNMESTAAGRANTTARYSTVGLDYYSVMVPSPDRVPPTTPAELAGFSSAPGTAFIHWQPSHDDIGVAGYNVHRDGVKIGSSINPSFKDKGVPAGTHAYWVNAFDLAGNISSGSATIQVTTK